MASSGAVSSSQRLLIVVAIGLVALGFLLAQVATQVDDFDAEQNLEFVGGLFAGFGILLAGTALTLAALGGSAEGAFRAVLLVLGVLLLFGGIAFNVSAGVGGLF